MFIPSIYRKSPQPTTTQVDNKLSTEMINYINSKIEGLIKPHFEIFENEDIKPNIVDKYKNYKTMLTILFGKLGMLYLDRFIF